jgi:vacuolar-type H+-ATPase subunit E/Vma4
MVTVDGSIEDLSRAIMNEARAEADEIQEKAQAAADAVRERAKSDAAGVRTQILEKAAQDSERIRSQASASAKLAARARELEQREQLLDGVFSEAANQLAAVVRRKDYAAIAGTLVREAVMNLRSPVAQVRADAATQKTLGAGGLDAIAKELNVQLSFGPPLESGTGVVAATEDNRLNFDNTFETRLERMKPSLRADVYRLLNGEQA